MFSTSILYTSSIRSFHFNFCWSTVFFQYYCLSYAVLGSSSILAWILDLLVMHAVVVLLWLSFFRLLGFAAVLSDGLLVLVSFVARSKSAQYLGLPALLLVFLALNHSVRLLEVLRTSFFLF